MRPRTEQALRVLFVAYVVATFVHIAYVIHHEPFSFDAWNVAIDSGAKPPTVSRFFSFWHQQYTSSNPRLGQPLAYLAYKIMWVDEIVSPLAFLAIVLAGFAIGTGRWPSRKNGRDLAALAIGIGLMWFAAPYFPSYLFCRAYATNYVWAAAVQLWFLVPLCLHERGRAAGVPATVAYGLAGIAAGMCNEHTGPTLLAFMACYVAWSWWKRRRSLRLAAAGLLGALVGYGLLFFAPGQSQRYDSLAERYGVAEQILVRGLRGNLDILQNLLIAAAPLLLVLTFVIVVGTLAEHRTGAALEEARQRQRRSIIVICFCLCAALTIGATIFASPKLGDRFYMHAMLLLLAGVIGAVSAFLNRPRALAPFVGLAILASGYAAARTVPLFTRLSRASDERLAKLASTPRGTVCTLTAWEQIPHSWWFLGDDARDQMKQELIAHYFDLARVLYRGHDMWATLGVTDVKLTMKYQFDRPICLDEVDALDLPPYIGHDVVGLHHAFLDAITRIQRSTDAHLHSIDLVADFLGTRPPMPRDTIYVARWKEGVLEGYKSGMRRIGRTRNREVLLGKQLEREPWAIYVVAVGDPPKLLGTSTSTNPLVYQPWRTGEYWVLACKTDYCFVTYAVEHSI